MFSDSDSVPSFKRFWFSHNILVTSLLNRMHFISFSVSIFPESGNFNVDNVRVCKILVSIKIVIWLNMPVVMEQVHILSFSL